LDEYQQLNKLGKYSPGILMTSPRTRNNYGHDEESVDGTSAEMKLRRRRRLQSTDNLPDSVDWVEKGAVVPVKNQGKRKKRKAIRMRLRTKV
jgi:hypothetical protein